MNELLDRDFWENMAVLNKFADQKWREPEKEKSKEADAPKGFVPNVDIFKTVTQVIVSCEVSGLERESLEVNLTDQRSLVIKGRIREHEYALARSSKERRYGKFVRHVKLPVPVDFKRMKVHYQDGLLELHFPRIIKPRVKKTVARNGANGRKIYEG